MGCVQGKGMSYTPPRGGLDKLKLENGYHVKGRPPKQDPPHDAPVKLPPPGVQVVQVVNGSGGGGGGGGGERKIFTTSTTSKGGGGEIRVSNYSNNGSGMDVANVSQRITVVKKIGGDELVDGWPKWLVDNIPIQALSGLVPKTADSYDKLAKVGQGTYSNVYKARDRDTGKIVALKKVRFDTSEPESVKFMAREIIILRQLDHPNIIKLEGLATSRMQYSLYLVFDFMQSDLTRIISRPEGRLTEPQVKCYMQQLLSGLEHCHDKGILHRDIKGSNLLIDKNGMLKIADFGLANHFQPKQKRPLTSRVVTLWYRAPELLLGSTDYGVGIDLWSAGCLLAEMFVGRPIMPGRTEVEQLHRIFKLCGSPSEDYWKKGKPPTTFRPPQQYKSSFQEAFTNFPDSSFGLLTTLLALDPAYRGTAASARQNEFFCSNPLACDLSCLPVINKVEDDPTQTNDRKKNRVIKSKQRSWKSRAAQESKESTTEQGKEDYGSLEEEKHAEQNMHSQEMGNSGSSITSSLSVIRQICQRRMIVNEESPPQSPSPTFQSNRNRSAKTEAHPNATKNIKNFPILLASMSNESNNFTIEDNRLTLTRRSMSTDDFRKFELEKMSKLFGLEEN